MTVSEIIQATHPAKRPLDALVAAALCGLVLWQPALAWETARFVINGMIDVTPIVIPGILLAAYITASGASDRIAGLFHGRTLWTVAVAACVGAVVPVCGVTVLPLMAGLLAAGVPLAPVMAFWLASPITGPAILSATIATLGWQFAIGKLAAAIGLGLLGGGATALFANRDWCRTPLRSNRLVGLLGGACGSCSGEKSEFDPRIWREKARRVRFAREAWAIARLILVVLAPAFAAEFLLNTWLRPDALVPYVGHENLLAVPLAVVVGGPAYIDGYAALPLTRALLEHGMSPGAAMAFLVSGGVISIWGAMAIFPVLRLKPFLLYLTLAAVGAMLAGWIFGALVG